jgi:hypothetical protein
MPVSFVVTKTEADQQSFSKTYNTKFYENPFSVYRVVSYEQRDG